MKQHLLLLAQLPDIEQILATRSLFQFEGKFNEEQPERLCTLEHDSDPQTRLLFTAESQVPAIWATTHGDNIEFTVNSEFTLPDELRHLLEAMGLKQCGRSSEGISMGSLNAEVLFDRISTLDSAWILLRRLKSFEPDPNRLQLSALTLLQFARTWHLNCVRVCNREETAAMRRDTERLIAQAASFTDWKVSGLNALKLNFDPRGSAFSLMFDGYHPMEVSALAMDWSVGPPLNQNANPKPGTFGKYDVRPTRIPAEVQGVLNGLVVDKSQVKIAERLTPRLYAKVNELLTTLGGQWTSSQQAHVFAEDPTPMLDALTSSGEVYTAKDYEFFATQPTQVSQVIEEANILPGMTVIEPSAGGGALAMAAAEIVGKANVTCYELMPQNVKTLTTLGFHLEGPQDFLAVKPEPVADRVILNPPFSGGREMAHIRHAMGFLKPGGMLVAIASTQWQTHDTKPAKAFRDYVATLGGKVIAIPAGAFKAAGTDVATTMLVLKKPASGVKAPTQTKAVEFSEVQAELF